LGFVVDAVFEVAKDNNAGLGTIGVAIFIRFDDKNVHRRESISHETFAFEGKVSLFVDSFKYIVIFKLPFLLVVVQAPLSPRCRSRAIPVC